MNEQQKVAKAAELMNRFAENTGLSGDGPSHRYLWTDAFAVCNFLELHKRTREGGYRELAVRLVDQVHQLLGRHHGDDSRCGWISGLAEDKGRLHPTVGGLRIGKDLPERRPEEVYDRQLEWERDGQYFHYLTKWMHALHAVFLDTGEEQYDRWAGELAGAAHRGFTYQPHFGGPRLMHWKMSIDLSRPLVAGMGQHDPVDGYTSYLELQSTSTEDLHEQIAEMAKLCEGRHWTTEDPLGIGGLLCAGLTLSRYMVEETISQHELLQQVLAASVEGLALITRQKILSGAPEHRLAFRELGLSIGLHGVENIRKCFRYKPWNHPETASLKKMLDILTTYQETAAIIENFWLTDESQQTESWLSHRDINMVMLATSLIPDGFLA
ncbi:MAG: hypothetical protein ACWGOX_10695 [Desulforhopalus sp.]